MTKTAPGQEGGSDMTATEQVTAGLTSRERRELTIRRQMAGLDTHRHWMSEFVTGDVFRFAGVRWGVLHFDYPPRPSGKPGPRALYCINLDNPGRIQEWRFASGNDVGAGSYEPTNSERTASAQAWWQRVCEAERAELAALRGRP